ncbi:transposase [Limnobacter parvus]|uniref:transposase n=1 Tax=Limnobacter parvus TaxID=2939690 RepID=UPI0035302D83
MLKTIPGVGARTAISYKTSIDDPTRFTSVADVGAFLGLTPKRYQSGEVDRNGGISKHGSRQTRSLLYEAVSCLLTRYGKHTVSCLLTRYGKHTTLAAWATKLRERLGFKKAVVALARKLSTLMLSMWRSGEVYRSEIASV